MPPRPLSALSLVLSLFSVSVVDHNRGRAMYTPVPLLILLSLLAAALGLVPSPNAQGVVHTLLVATLGGSVLQLQMLVGARLPMLIIPILLLSCGMYANTLLGTLLIHSKATVLSFLSHFSFVTPVVLLLFILTTLGVTACLVVEHRKPRLDAVALTLTPVPPSPASSHTSFQHANSSFEKPTLSLFRLPSKDSLFSRRPSLTSAPPPVPSTNRHLFVLLTSQVFYTIATAFCIPPALHPSSQAPPLIVAVFSSHSPLSSTYIFRILDTVFTIFTLVSVFIAYFLHSRCPSSHDPEFGFSGGDTPAPRRTPPAIPPRPDIRIISPPTSPTPTRVHSIVLPFSPSNRLKAKHKQTNNSVSSSFFSPREGSYDPATSVKRRSMSDEYPDPQALVRPRSKMSMWGRLPLPLSPPPGPAYARRIAPNLRIDTNVSRLASEEGASAISVSAPGARSSPTVRFEVKSSDTARPSRHSYSPRSPPRPRTPPPLKTRQDDAVLLRSRKLRKVSADFAGRRKSRNSRASSAEEDALIAQRLLVELGSAS
ncbi:hypothetical protein H0H93_013316 [Arthromyces matolae]|nr:hypothetical protein H0H93_013316 [Arthromyces matolae]